MKKIVFGITSLTLGGAERVLVDIVNELKKEYDITIFTLYGKGEFESQLDYGVKLVSVYDKPYKDLNIFQKKYMSLCMINKNFRKKLFNKYIKDKYDIEIAFLEGPITWLFSESSSSKKIAWIHNDITQVFGNDRKAQMKKKLSEECYEKYDSLVFVSKDNLKKFEEIFNNNKNYKQVIHNYINSNNVITKSNVYVPKEYADKDIIFTVVSRLTAQKGIDRLIEVHKKLVKDYPHHIYVIGDGPLKEELMSKVNTLKLQDTFHLLGKKENPYPYIKNATYFMLPSIYEGYGMVIEEAKILSKYILITDTAAREAIENYENSMVVENSNDGIYNGMKKLIENKISITKETKINNKDIINDIIDLMER